MLRRDEYSANTNKRNAALNLSAVEQTFALHALLRPKIYRLINWSTVYAGLWMRRRDG